MNMENEKLFAVFPPVSTQEWMDKINADLKGADFEKKLVWKTTEGFKVNPFYRREDIADLKSKDTLPGEFPYIRGIKASNEWYVRQDLSITDLTEANAKMKKAIACGTTSFGLHLKHAHISKESLLTLLDGIDVTAVELNFYSCRSVVVKLAGMVVETLSEKTKDLDKCVGSIGFEVFKKQMLKGVATDEWIRIAQDLIVATAPLKQYTCINIKGVDMANAGAYIHQELGYSLAAGADVIVTLVEQCGLSVDEVARKIRFDLGIGSNYFMEIAKFRAARWLWALIAKNNGASDQTSRLIINAETNRWNKTVYDAYVNLLRTQTEAMSAAIAGVHSLNVLPFDIVYKDADEFSERIARNQQLLLKEESHFDKVVDPSGGSYYIEHLTDAIAHQAWKLFLEVEDNGGFAAMADKGIIQEAINKSNTERHKAVATRREALLGTNIFPNFNETANDRLATSDGRHSCGCEKMASVTPLDLSRGASDFEALRLSTEAATKRPKVFMLTIGNLAMRLARSQFSSNFFACAGYEVIDNLGFKTVQEGVDAAMAAGADIITLCSSDDEYAEFGPQAFDIIAGRVPLVIAGAPACMEELQSKGIEHFIHVKVNVLETLTKFQQLLNIKG